MTVSSSLRPSSEEFDTDSVAAGGEDGCEEESKFNFEGAGGKDGVAAGEDATAAGEDGAAAGEDSAAAGENGAAAGEDAAAAGEDGSEDEFPEFTGIVSS